MIFARISAKTKPQSPAEVFSQTKWRQWRCVPLCKPRFIWQTLSGKNIAEYCTFFIEDILLQQHIGFFPKESEAIYLI